MKKSSLGRRSSLLGQGRLSNADKNSIRNTAESKKSFIPKPTSFGSKNERSSSVDRDGFGSSVKKDQHPPSGLRRSRSFLDLNRNSTCQTPTQLSRRNTAGSCRKFSESTGRPSSMGAPKSARKESRPISEKSFQLDAQHKVQEFFMNRAPHLLDNGNIKPMTAAMFTNLVQFLIQRYDKKIVINKANLIEEILNICKLYNYRGKAEKSWLMTVNAPHSWPYVVSFLLWLVEITSCSEVFDVFEALYPDRVEGDPDAENEDNFNFKLLVPRLLRGYRNGNTDEEMQQYLIEHKQALGLDDEEHELLQQQYNDLQKELFDSEDVQEQEKLESLENAVASLRDDINKTRSFNYDTENYVATMKRKREERVAMFDDHEHQIQALLEKQKDLQIMVSSQEMSPELQREIQEKVAILHQDCRQLNDQITDYQNEVYKIDIDLVKNRNEFSRVIQAYNKEITVNSVRLPALKSAQIENTKQIPIDAMNGGKPFEHIDGILKDLRVMSKNRKRDKEMEVQQDLLSVQKKEDELTVLTEENDALISQHEQFTNETIEIKRIMSKDKEQTKAALNEYQKMIKMKKEQFQTTESGLAEELSTVEKHYLEQKKIADKQADEGLKFLDEKKRALEQFEQDLENDTRKVFEETKKKIEEIVREN
ncbi:kinetochore protein NDC80 homolog [Planococcus citri]|uniref:kinetochore protein NDC80 homolog n=1 Tax=Planococcus citri TaxID=170843 RepID=UPI0031F7BABF